MRNPQRINDTLKRLLDIVTEEAARNPTFASQLEGALCQIEVRKKPPIRPHRRARGVVDPFAVFADTGDVGVRRALEPLSIDQLKDIVAEHGMDRSKLAMKWKTPDRFIELIVETVATRSRKGDAFR